MKLGPVQCARNGSVRLAYRVIGDGDTPLVSVPGRISNVDSFDEPAGVFRALAGAGEVLVSRTVRDLSAGSGLVFEDRGTHQLKGVTEEWQIFRVS